jgi:hypothetical protein
MKKNQLTSILQPLYNASHNMRSFVQSTLSQHDCIVFELWFDAYVGTHCTFPFEDEYFMISRQSIDSWEFSINYMRSDQSYTFALHHGGGSAEFFPYGQGADRVPVD